MYRAFSNHSKTVGLVLRGALHGVIVISAVQGVPIRIEVGPRDVKADQAVVVRRDNGEKVSNKTSYQQLRLLSNIENSNAFFYLPSSKKQQQTKTGI